MRRRGEPKPIVRARELTVQELFTGRTYRLEAFQRSYAWSPLEVERLIDDLAGRFQAEWNADDHVPEVDKYDPYFLGSIITYQRDGQIFLADGQQRVVTLLMLLIYLHGLTSERVDDHSLDLNAVLRTLVRREEGMRKRFAIRVDDDYDTCFDRLLNARDLGTDGLPPDAARVWTASRQIVNGCPDFLKQEALLHFIRWLLVRVSLVELDASDTDRAQEMYVTMNDRGVRLAPLDLLKNYLLTDAVDDTNRFDRLWKSMVRSLEATDRDAPLDFVRSVLHGRHFDVDKTTASERLRETAPHEWLRRHTSAIWHRPRRGVQLALFTDWLQPLHAPYTKVRGASAEFRRGDEIFRFNALNGITRQFDLAVAAAQRDEPGTTVLRKARLIANYIDLFVITRGLQEDPYTQDELDQEMKNLYPRVRESPTLESLSEILGEATHEWYVAFEAIPTLVYRSNVNRPFVSYLLARLTDWLNEGAGLGRSMERFLERSNDHRPHEVEHLFTKRTNAYQLTNDSKADFQRVRSRLGALVLIDGTENASLGGSLLSEKIEAYLQYNTLAASLHPRCYTERGSVRFRRFINERGLADKFRAYEDGEPLEPFISQRGELYEAMARQIWAPEALGFTRRAVNSRAKANAGGRRTRLSDLLLAGLVRPDESLIGKRKGIVYRGTLLGNGKIRTESGEQFSTPNRAAMEARNVRSEDGWKFWIVEDTGQSLYALKAKLNRPV